LVAEQVAAVAQAQGIRPDRTPRVAVAAVAVQCLTLRDQLPWWPVKLFRSPLAKLDQDLGLVALAQLRLQMEQMAVAANHAGLQGRALTSLIRARAQAELAEFSAQLGGLAPAAPVA